MQHIHSPTKLTIDLGAVAENYKTIKNYVGENVVCAATVKANAYGIGVQKIVSKLSSVGCNKFFVMTIDEAIHVREFSLTDEIFVFAGIRKGEENYFYLHNLTPVLNSVEEVIIWQKFAKRKNLRMSAILHYDTGMNRMGMDFNEIKELLEQGIENNINIINIMSHLACADNPDDEYNEKQYQKMLDLHNMFPKIEKSLANSAGIFLGKKYHFHMVRPGASLYGIKDSPLTPKLKPVISLKSDLCFIKKCKEDEFCGYSRTYKLKKGMTIGVVPIGFADGMLRSASNKGFCFIADTKVPMIGRISMDTIIVDISHLDEKDIYVGAEVEIIGDNCSIEDVALYSDSSAYEVITAISNARCRKEYLRATYIPEIHI